MIDIIIPAYNAHNTIMRTLFSIYYQTISDKLNVYICNDCSEKDYSEEVNFFKDLLNIKELKLEKNSGPGIARQTGIDYSDSEYIMFIDSDDVFSSPYSVSILYNTIKDRNLDLVGGSFTEELPDYKRVRSEDTVWLHGKIYRRKFLVDHKIRFNNTYCNEDNGFNQSIFLRNPKAEYIKPIVYYWCFNENSITRKNNFKYQYTGILGYVYNITWALKSAIEDNADYDNIAFLAFAALNTMYYYYARFIDEKDSEQLLINSKELKEICMKYPVKDEKEKRQIFDDEYEYFSKEIKDIDKLKVTFEEFCNLISEVSE